MGGKLTIYHGSQKLIQQPVYGAGNVRNDYGLGFTVQKMWILQKNGHAQKKTVDMPIVIN